MNVASITELKKELIKLEPSRLVEVCLRLAKYKIDNKELLTYLLFESDNEIAYVSAIKHKIDEQIKNLNRSNIYYLKKGLRKILRQLDKYIRYSANKETETELRIYFCQKMIDAKISIKRSKVLFNLYEGQIKKIKNSMGKLHEDLQYDYGLRVEEIQI